MAPNLHPVLAEHPDAKVQLQGEPYARNLTISLPFPVIRGDAFNDNLPGVRLYELMRGAQLREVVFSPGLKGATYTTFLLLLLTYVVTLSGLLTAAKIGVMSRSSRSVRRWPSGQLRHGQTGLLPTRLTPPRTELREHHEED